MKLSLIAAVAKNGVIGRDNDLVWREREDLRHLTAATMGHAVVMGRKTWQSLPAKFRPLPGRRNVVVTHNRSFEAPGAECVASLGDALALLADTPQVFVIGGGAIYAAALPLADELLLTEIAAEFEGDTHFPAWDRSHFREAARRELTGAGGTPFAIVRYARCEPARQHQD